MNYQASLTLKSGNVKTGPIPVSTASYATCPTACPLRKAGCYADSGPLAMHWKKVTEGERGTGWGSFVALIAALPEGSLWRHNQAGDLPGDGVTIDADALGMLVEANRGKRGFTFSHYDAFKGINYGAIKDANQNGFTVNLSANDLEHADALAALDIGPVAATVPTDSTENTYTPKGRKVVLCPATQREGVSCETCQLCQRPNRSVIIGFPAHGTSKKKADAISRRVITIAQIAQ